MGITQHNMSIIRRVLQLMTTFGCGHRFKATYHGLWRVFQVCRGVTSNTQMIFRLEAQASTGSEPPQFRHFLTAAATSSAKVGATCNMQMCTREDSVSFRKPLRLTAVS